MSRRHFPRRIPRNETPEQARARMDREEIANAQTRAMANRGLSSYKSAAQEDWDIVRAHQAAKAAA